MKIVFFGTSSFAAHILRHLIEKNFPIVSVVTKQDAEKGRSLQMLPPPVKKMLIEISSPIPVYQPAKASAPEFAETLKKYDPDLFLVVAYGEILKSNILSLPKKSCINVHASLLPKYRGAAPIHRSIMAGDLKTGITIMEMVREMDAGDIIAQEEVSIEASDNFAEVEAKLLKTSCLLLEKVLNNFNSFSKVPQDHTKATYAAKLTAEDEVIHWQDPACKIFNQIRALSPYPGASCEIIIGGQAKRLKIKKSSIDINFSGTPGQILFCDNKKLVIGCGEGSLSLEEIQLEGKKQMNIADFLAGYRGKFSFVS